MSKRKKAVLLISALLAVLVMAGFVTAPYFVNDSLVCTEFYPIGDNSGSYWFNNVTESGQSVTGSLSVEKAALSENYYLYTFTFNNSASSDLYDISKFKLILDLPDGVSVTEAFGSSGGSAYTALTAISGTELEFESESGYMHLTVLLFKECGDGDISVNLQYSIDGKDLYSQVHFGGIEQNFVI